MITGVSRVVLQVADQEAARAFWIEKVGFECVHDTTMGDERWIEVRPPSGGPVISLVAGGAPVPTSDAPSLPTSNIFLACDDIVATHAELSARGVRFAQPPIQQPFGWWAVIEDPDGQRHALRQDGDEPLKV